MSTDLVRRDPRPTGRPVIPKQLLAKKRLTPGELWYVWWDTALAWMCLAAFLATLAADVALLDVGASPLVVLVLAAFAVAGFASVLSASRPATWLGKEGSGDDLKTPAWKPYRRRRAVLDDRGRRGAPHAHQRAARAADVDYSQYSVTVDRQGGELVVGVMRHSCGVGERIWRVHDRGALGRYDALAGKWAWGEPPPPPKRRQIADGPDGEPRWQEWREVEREPRFDGDTDTTYNDWVDIGPPVEPEDPRPWATSDGKNVRINAPTLDRVTTVVAEANERAEELEAADYRQEVDKKKMERMALLFQPPPSGAAERALVHGEEIDEGLASLLGDERRP